MPTISAMIKNYSYHPTMSRKLKKYKLEDIVKSFPSEGSFIVSLQDSEIAVSWWVSAKRTRSYPYERVYDTLSFAGKKATIIPIFKDEGIQGERDYLQWDTISMMSLLGIYVIIAFYSTAEKSSRYENKITKQRFDSDYIQAKLNELKRTPYSVIEWNSYQTDNINEIGEKAIESYRRISKKIGVQMHPFDSAIKRIDKISKSRQSFMISSRELAQLAQMRESSFDQPSENVDGTKARLTISDSLGGIYFLTSDEMQINGDQILLIEAKHSGTKELPSKSDIKDGFFKMSLFTNLEDVKMNGRFYKPMPVLKLTSSCQSTYESLSSAYQEKLKNIFSEGKKNGFKILYNDKYLEID